MSPSIKDVAAMAGVSTATVSHVLNGTRYVAEETKQRVYQAMKDLDYRPNLVARSLRSQKSRIIGLLIPVAGSDTSNFFFMAVAQGVQNVLKQHGYHLILSNSNENRQDEEEQIRMFNSQFIDGLIIAPTNDDHSYLKDALGNYPVVFIDRKPQGIKGDSVLSDKYSGVYEGMKYLLDQGHRKIGFISRTLGDSRCDERFEAYIQIMSERRLLQDASLVEIGEASYEGGYKCAKKLYDNEGVSALFVANNIMAMGAIGLLNERKVNIPSEVAIIGFDDYEWCRITKPPLSVIRQPSYELGEKAAEILLKRIDSSISIIEEFKLPTTFIQRESC